MTKVFLFITILFVLTGCGNSRNESNVLQRRFAVADFCYEEVINYFQRKDTVALGAMFEFTKFERRLLGLENIVGMANVSSTNLKKRDLDSLINGALNNCHPNMRTTVSKDDVLAKNLFEHSNFLGKQLDSNYLIRVTNYGIEIYTRE